MRLNVLAGMVLLLAWTATPASAEWFADLYGGGAFTHNADVTATLPGVFSATFEDAEFERSLVVGGRAGYWFQKPSFKGLSVFGLGLDVSHFQPNVKGGTFDSILGTVAVDDADIQVTAISLDMMLRAPYLVSPAFPKGRVQLSFFVGPSVFLTDVDGGGISVEGLGQVLPEISDKDTSLGVKVGYGLAWLFTKNIGVFGEYRFTHVNPEVEESGVKWEADLNTHHVLGGVSFRF